MFRFESPSDFPRQVSFFDLTGIIQRITAPSFYQNNRINRNLSSALLWYRSVPVVSFLSVCDFSDCPTWYDFFYLVPPYDKKRATHLLVEIVKSTLGRKELALRKIAESKPLSFGARQSECIYKKWKSFHLPYYLYLLYYLYFHLFYYLFAYAYYLR